MGGGPQVPMAPGSDIAQPRATSLKQLMLAPRFSGSPRRRRKRAAGGLRAQLVARRGLSRR